MSSSDSADVLRFDRDLPTTEEDVAVLRRLGHGLTLTFDEYLKSLAALDPPAITELRSRRGPRGAPFDLLRDDAGGRPATRSD